MSLEFIDGFDYYSNANVGLKWYPSSTSSSFVTGRFGGKAAQNTNLGVFLPQVTTRVIGAAFYFTGFTGFTTEILAFLDTTTAGSGFGGRAEQASLGYTSLGALNFSVNGSILNSTVANTLVVDTWYYIEAQIVIGTSYTIKLNGTTVLTGTGFIQTTSNAYTDGIAISGPANMWIDDLYILNSNGALNNTFLGECRIKTDLPSGDGFHLQFTPSTGVTHFNLVNETGPDMDATYVFDTNPGDIDTYTFNAETLSGGTIVALQNSYVARKDDSGTRQVAEVMRISSTDYVGTTHNLNSAYSMFLQLRETDPSTSSPWNLTNVNAAEIGVKVIS